MYNDIGGLHSSENEKINAVLDRSTPREIIYDKLAEISEKEWNAKLRD